VAPTGLLVGSGGHGCPRQRPAALLPPSQTHHSLAACGSTPVASPVSYSSYFLLEPRTRCAGYLIALRCILPARNPLAASVRIIDHEPIPAHPPTSTRAKGCGYFAYAPSNGTCAVYNAEAGCPDDTSMASTFAPKTLALATCHTAAALAQAGRWQIDADLVRQPD